VVCYVLIVRTPVYVDGERVKGVDSSCHVPLSQITSNIIIYIHTCFKTGAKDQDAAVLYQRFMVLSFDLFFGLIHFIDLRANVAT